MRQQIFTRVPRLIWLVAVQIFVSLQARTQSQLLGIDTIRFSTPVWVTLPQGGNSLIWQTKINNVLTRIAINDSMITVAVRSGKKWGGQAKASHSLTFRDGTEISTADLDNDGSLDLVVSDPVMRGNYTSTVFLFRPLQACFRHASSFDLMNIRTDSNTGLIRSSCLGGLFDNRKELYKLKRGTLIFYKGVREAITMDSANSTIDYYFESHSGKQRVIHHRAGTPDSISNEFENALWRGFEP